MIGKDSKDPQVKAVVNGNLKKTGQPLLQKAVEAHVYAVLGARARKRWRIVGADARSLQTQQIFAKIVKDTIAQGDYSIGFLICKPH